MSLGTTLNVSWFLPPCESVQHLMADWYRCNPSQRIYRVNSVSPLENKPWWDCRLYKCKDLLLEKDVDFCKGSFSFTKPVISVSVPKENLPPLTFYKRFITVCDTLFTFVNYLRTEVHVSNHLKIRSSLKVCPMVKNVTLSTYKFLCGFMLPFNLRLHLF